MKYCQMLAKSQQNPSKPSQIPPNPYEFSQAPGILVSSSNLQQSSESQQIPANPSKSQQARANLIKS